MDGAGGAALVGAGVGDPVTRPFWFFPRLREASAILHVCCCACEERERERAEGAEGKGGDLPSFDLFDPHVMREEGPCRVPSADLGVAPSGRRQCMVDLRDMAAFAAINYQISIADFHARPESDFKE